MSHIKKHEISKNINTTQQSTGTQKIDQSVDYRSQHILEYGGKRSGDGLGANF